MFILAASPGAPSPSSPHFLPVCSSSPSFLPFLLLSLLFVSIRLSRPFPSPHPSPSWLLLLPSLAFSRSSSHTFPSVPAASFHSFRHHPLHVSLPVFTARCLRAHAGRCPAIGRINQIFWALKASSRRVLWKESWADSRPLGLSCLDRAYAGVLSGPQTGASCHSAAPAWLIWDMEPPSL